MHAYRVTAIKSVSDIEQAKTPHIHLMNVLVTYVLQCVGNVVRTN